MTTAVADQRLSVLPSLLKRYERVKRSWAFKGNSPADFHHWRKQTIAGLKKLTGFDTMQTCPLRPRLTKTVECDGYTRQHIEIQTEPGVIMTLCALVPADLKPGQRRPAVICAHGHGSGGKWSPAGVGDDELVAKQIKHYNYDYGVQFARLGLVAFCPDARGFGERQEPSIHGSTRASILASSCQFINQMAFPLGQTVTGMWAWDLHRLVDYIQTRKDCDANRIGCGGLSGGGLQTLWATALDEKHRIKAAIVSGYFYGYKESLLIQHQNCSCNYVPHLYEHMDMGDIGSLIAPRPLLIETGTRDGLNGKSGMKNVIPQVAMARRTYKVLGAQKNLVHDAFDAAHVWSGKISVPWMVQQLTA